MKTKYKGFPKKKFKVIYLDPPYKYRDKGNAGERGASHKYKTLSLTELILLPVERICTRNCAIFMWVTFPMLMDGYALLKAWGFQKTNVAFVWVKLSKRGTYKMGLGHMTRSNAELVLIAVKGHPKRKSKGVNQIVATVPEEHSRKPEEVRKRIETLMGKVSRIELFARRTKKLNTIRGWTRWGLEA